MTQLSSGSSWREINQPTRTRYSGGIGSGVQCINTDHHKGKRDDSGLLWRDMCWDSADFFRFLMSKKFSWSANVTVIVNKAQQRFHILSVLRRENTASKLFVAFYFMTIERLFNILRISVWYSGYPLQRVIKTEKITSWLLPQELGHFYDTSAQQPTLFKTPSTLPTISLSSWTLVGAIGQSKR